MLYQQSFNIFEEEIAKAERGEESLCYTLDTFSAAIQTVRGRAYFLEDINGQARIIGIAGNKDGGLSINGWLLEQCLSDAYRGNLTQVNGSKLNILWYGQPLDTAEKLSQATRGLYAQVCSGYTSGQIQTEARNIGAIRRTAQGLSAYTLEYGGIIDFTKPRPIRKLIAPVGYEAVSYENIF